MSRRAYESGGRWSRLVFDGDEKNYELWETTFLGHLRLQGLKDIILNEPYDGDDEEEDRNAEAYAELIQFLDDKSLSLVMQDAADQWPRSTEDFERLLCWKRKTQDNKPVYRTDFTSKVKYRKCD